MSVMLNERFYWVMALDRLIYDDAKFFEEKVSGKM